MPAKKEIEPLIKLTPTQQKELEDLGSLIERAEGDLDLLKQLGMATEEMEGTLDSARKTRDLLLKRFGNKP